MLVPSSKPPSFPYPFDNASKPGNDNSEPDEFSSSDASTPRYTTSMNSIATNLGAKATNVTAPRSIGSVFSQEWRELLKFIAVSKGTTELPQGLEPMSFRPGNLPPKSEDE